MAGVPLSEVLSGILLDSFDLIIILLLIGGILFYRQCHATRLILPYYFSLLFTVACIRILPLQIVPAIPLPFLPNPSIQSEIKTFFLFFWFIGWVLLIMVLILDRNKQKLLFGQKFLHLFFSIAWLILLWMAFRHWKTLDISPWHSINLALLIILLFYLWFLICPQRWLPLLVTQDIGKLFIYIGIGLYVVRACMWGYAAFHASIGEGSGSFRLKGKPFALQYAKAWQFNHLQELILNHWYYPAPIDQEQQLPAPQEKLPLLTNGLQEAEAFRRSLFQIDNFDKVPMLLIAQAMVQFIEISNNTLIDRPNLSNFILNAHQLERRVWSMDKGSVNYDTFDSFSGEWFGIWDQLKVNHNWDDVEILKPPYYITGNHPMLVHALQYAWIGDGFGWNAIVYPLDMKKSEVILGSVYHIVNGDESKIRNHRPHVGIPVDKQRLIWLTQNEIFFEEVMQESGIDKYVITGFNYYWDKGVLKSYNQAFQAIYTRNKANRPPWFEFNIDIQIE